MEKYESLKRTAEIVGIKSCTLRKYSEEGLIPYMDLSLGRAKYERRVYRPSAVLAALRGLEQKNERRREASRPRLTLVKRAGS